MLSGQLFISSISSVTINFHPFYAWDISWHTDPALWHRLHLEISPETPWAHLVDSCCIQMTQPLTNCRSAATGDLHQPPTFAFRNECVQRLSLSLSSHQAWTFRLRLCEMAEKLLVQNDLSMTPCPSLRYITCSNAAHYCSFSQPQRKELRTSRLSWRNTFVFVWQAHS